MSHTTNPNSPDRILIVAEDTRVLDSMLYAARTRPSTQVSSAASGAHALRLDRIQPHHLVVADTHLSDQTGLDFAREILALRRRPVILIAEDPSADDVLQALRLGVADFLPPYSDSAHFLLLLDQCLKRHRGVLRTEHREQRLTSLLRRVLHDRRSLNQRIDLICRDLVGAQRRLFHRIITLEHRDSFTS